MKNSTTRLLELMEKETNLTKYITDIEDAYITKPLHILLNDLCIEKNLPLAQVQKTSGIQKGYFYELLRGTKKHPSRDKILAILIAMNCTVDECQTILLRIGFSPLYIRNKRDCIIYFARKENYSLEDTNIALEDNGLKSIE